MTNIQHKVQIASYINNQPVWLDRFFWVFRFLFLVPSLLFLFASARMTKPAIHQLFGVRKYSVSYRNCFIHLHYYLQVERLVFVRLSASMGWIFANFPEWVSLFPGVGKLMFPRESGSGYTRHRTLDDFSRWGLLRVSRNPTKQIASRFSDDFQETF